MKYLSVLVLLLFSNIVNAGSQQGRVLALVVHDNGSGVEKLDVKLSGVGENIPWSSTGKEWTLYFNNEASKAQFAMLQAAYIADLEVQIDSDGTAVCPDGGRNRIRNVRYVK